MCPGHQISIKLCPWELSRWIVESRKRMTVGGLEDPGFKGVENRETIRDNKDIGMCNCKGR